MRIAIQRRTLALVENPVKVGRSPSAPELNELIESGEVTPVVGKDYQLSEVPQATRDLGQRRTRVKSVVVV